MARHHSEDEKEEATRVYGVPRATRTFTNCPGKECPMSVLERGFEFHRAGCLVNLIVNRTHAADCDSFLARLNLVNDNEAISGLNKIAHICRVTGRPLEIGVLGGSIPEHRPRAVRGAPDGSSH